MKLPFNCRPGQLKLMFDTLNECMDYYKTAKITQPTVTTTAVATTNGITNLEMGLSITIGIVGLLFAGLTVYVVKKMNCDVNCQCAPTINCPNAADIHALVDCLADLLDSSDSESENSDDNAEDNTDDNADDIADEESVEAPDTPPNSPDEDSPDEDSPQEVFPVPLPRRNLPPIAPVAPRRHGDIMVQVRPPAHQQPILSPEYQTPRANNIVFNYDSSQASSEETIDSVNTPSMPSERDFRGASISSTEFPARSMDVMVPNPSPPNPGPRSLPSQYRTPAYNPNSTMTIDQSESRTSVTVTPDRTNRFDETSFINTTNDEATTEPEAIEEPEPVIEDIGPEEIAVSSEDSVVFQRRPDTDMTSNGTSIDPANTGFFEDTGAESEETDSDNNQGEERTEDPTEENPEAEEDTEDITEDNEEMTEVEEDNEESTEVQEDSEEASEDIQEDSEEAPEDIQDPEAENEAMDSPTNSENERELRRQRRLQKLAKNLQSQVNYDRR